MEKVKRERPYLFIDGFNNFIRHYVVNEAVSQKSQPVGGVVGFIKTLHYLNEQFAPSKIFVVWESGGGSKRRLRIFPEYKANRRGKSKSKNKKNVPWGSGGGSMRDVLLNDESVKAAQLFLLNRFLKTTPVCQIYVQDVEADDIISYLVKEKFANTNVDKIIVSADKDFYQLLDRPDVKVYDPPRRTLVTGADVKKEFGISPRNFALAKAIVGDASDNIDGITGVGMKTAIKRLPILANDDKDVMIGDIVKESRTQINENKSKVKVYKNILDEESKLWRNWKLIYLNSSTMSANQIDKVDAAIENHKPIMDKLAMIKLLNLHGVNFSFDFDRFASSMQQYLIYK